MRRAAEAGADAAQRLTEMISRRLAAHRRAPTAALQDELYVLVAGAEDRRLPEC
jgi:hypothetical protein